MTWWSVAEAAAQRVLAASHWRAQLAEAVRNASGARYAAVYTCPPWQLLAAQAATSPIDRQAITDSMFVNYLPRLMKSQDAVAQRVHAGEVFAPLERHDGLTDDLARELLTPAGIHSLLGVYLTREDQSPIGWIVLGFDCSSREALALHAAPLQRIAELASETLRRAIALAEACGVQAALPQEAALAVLSGRERQIVNLVRLGLSDANVASRLNLSETTIGSHLKKIFRRLNIHSRVELAARFSASTRATLVTPAADLTLKV